jgi:AcrR family transcriptional regulator
MEKKRKISLKIGKAAARLFNRKGYLETNMDNIAAAAKMSKGGIYHYFSSKDEILFFILSNYMDLILDGLEGQLNQIEDDLSKIQFIISRHIELYTHHLPEAKTLLHEARCLPKKYYNGIADKEREYYRIVAEVISGFLGTRAKDNKAQVTSLTFLLFGMCNWIYSWYDPKGAVSPESLSHMIWTVFSKGVDDYRT